MFDGNCTLKQPPILTEREKEVLPFLLSGATRIEIAQTLSVSSETVKFHTRQLLKKFGVKTVPEGYTAMQEYARLYLPEGMNFNYFIKTNRNTVTLHENRTDAHLVKDWDVVAIKPESITIQSVQHVWGQVENLRVNGTPTDAASVEAWRHVVNSSTDDTCLQGDEFNWLLECDLVNAYLANQERHAVTVGLPIGELIMTLNFPERQMPARVWFEHTRLGRPVDDPDVTFEIKGQCAQVIVPDVKFENRYAIHWRWVE